jgi:uncharacterized protein YecT (DUF1311 family)
MLENYMQKVLVITFISIGLSPPLSARTGFNCTKVLEMRDSRVEACVNQTNDWLNDNYQFLLNEYKNSPKRVESLQKIQQAWVKKRDIQCELAKKKSTGNGSLAESRCKVLLTYERAEDLEYTLLSLS